MSIQYTFICQYNTHLYVNKIHIYMSIQYTFICQYNTHLYMSIKYTSLYVNTIHIYMCQYNTHLYMSIKYTSLYVNTIHIYMSIKYTSLYVNTVHIYIRQHNIHLYVNTIHIYIFQNNTHVYVNTIHIYICQCNTHLYVNTYLYVTTNLNKVYSWILLFPSPIQNEGETYRRKVQLSPRQFTAKDPYSCKIFKQQFQEAERVDAMIPLFMTLFARHIEHTHEYNTFCGAILFGGIVFKVSDIQIRHVHQTWLC